MSLVGATWYHFDDPLDGFSDPWLQEFQVVRETPKCVVFKTWDRERFVLKDPAGRRYCYPTRELALESYLIRKRRQIQILAARHDQAKDYLQAAEDFKARGMTPWTPPEPGEFKFIR